MKKPSKAVLLRELAECDKHIERCAEKIALGVAHEVGIILEMRHWTSKAKLIQSML